MRSKSRTPPLLALAVALAERQYGLVTREQLLALGWTSAAIQRQLAAGRWHRVHRGVYALGHRLVGREGRWLAAVLAVGGGVLSHRSAAALWGTGRDARCIEVTTARHGAALAGVVVHRTRRLDVADVTVRRGVPVTSVPRTLIDLAGCLPADELVRHVEALQQLDLAALDRALRRTPGRAGTGPLRELVALRGPHLRSHLEKLLFALCRRQRLPLPVANARVAGHRVDFHWPQQRLVVETDGWAHHRDRRAFAGDRRRDVELQVARWRVVRFTYERVALDPAGVAGDLRELLA